MSLQRKFALLLGMLGLIVTINLGTALWSIWMLERVLSGPLASIGPVLADLHAIQRGLTRMGRGLLADGAATPHDLAWRFGHSGDPEEPGDPPEERRAGIESAIAGVRASLEHFQRNEGYRVRAGLSTTRTLKARVEAATDAAQRWLRDRDGSGFGDPDFNLPYLHELIQRMEANVINTARHETRFGGELRTSVLLILVASLTLLALSVALAAALVRRWVMKPVAALRDATARLARGDFSHRIAVSGRDELARLSDEVNHMAGTILAMQEERVDRERLAAVGEMTRRIVHNLRNPLAGIRSLAELSRADANPGSPLREHQDRIVATVDRFEAWLRGLLSAATPARINPVPTDIEPWLGRVLEPMRASAAVRGVEIVHDTQPASWQADFDPVQLEHAVVALVTNAIQASPNGSRVSVAARRDSADAWELRIADQGPGVPEELRERIFRPYFTTKRDGTGIGLALVKQVAEQHGGRVWVETSPHPHANRVNGDGGSVFVVRLPVRAGSDSASIGQR